MKILFIHQNFPGQFVHLARAFVERRCEVRAITDTRNRRQAIVPTDYYQSIHKSLLSGVGDSARPFAESVHRGELAAERMRQLRRDGYHPDLVIGHLGWGETIFVKDIWPNTKIILHAEYYYRACDGDIGFDHEFTGVENDAMTVKLHYKTRARNAAILLAMESADFGVAPTKWQGSRFPNELQHKIAIIHEGIDSGRIAPNDETRVRLGNGDTSIVLKPGSEVITFINRDLEPYRGYHTFMRALPMILKARPKAHAVIVGGDGVSYGAAAPAGNSWKNVFLNEVAASLPMERVHFVGRIAHENLINLMQVSAAHIYLTYPFVLSWSMLEAMSAGALVIGSKTAPVEEFIEDGRNGILVDFFDARAVADAAINALAEPAAHLALRRAARRYIVENYDLRAQCIPQWMTFTQVVMDGV